MTTPVNCDINGGDPVELGFILHADRKAIMTGTLEVVWDYKREEATDVVGFEVFIYFENQPNGEQDSISLTTGYKTQAGTIFTILESILGQSLVEFADNHCEIEPPTDGDIDDQIAYQENYDAFYPPRPRG